MNDRSLSDEELRLAMLRSLEQMFLHSEASTKFLGILQARVEGAMAVVPVIDENEARVQMDREVAARKELTSHLFDKTNQYTVIVIGGAYAAYFATLSTVAGRFSDNELRWSALLMTISLTVFVLWEVFHVTYMAYQMRAGTWGQLDEKSWAIRGWWSVLLVTLGTALPAIGLSMWVYLRGLGGPNVLASLVG